ncbi:MAG: hypothetical protein ABIA21_03465 [Candidatus Aenigmatarchaeota archaeon]
MTNCKNKEKNENDCPCSETDCPRHGICCECILYHRNSKTNPRPACVR